MSRLELFVILACLFCAVSVGLTWWAVQTTTERMKETREHVEKLVASNDKLIATLKGYALGRGVDPDTERN